MARRKHQKKDIEKVLKKAEGQQWTVQSKRKGYFMVMCSCPENHMRWVALTPSNPNYAKNLLAWLRRQSCWERER